MGNLINEIRAILFGDYSGVITVGNIDSWPGEPGILHLDESLYIEQQGCILDIKDTTFVMGSKNNKAIKIEKVWQDELQRILGKGRSSRTATAAEQQRRKHNS